MKVPETLFWAAFLIHKVRMYLFRKCCFVGFFFFYRTAQFDCEKQLFLAVFGDYCEIN